MYKALQIRGYPTNLNWLAGFLPSTDFESSDDKLAMLTPTKDLQLEFPPRADLVSIRADMINASLSSSLFLDRE